MREDPLVVNKNKTISRLKFLSRKLKRLSDNREIVNRQTNQKPKEVNILVFNETCGDLKQASN